LLRHLLGPCFVIRLFSRHQVRMWSSKLSSTCYIGRCCQALKKKTKFHMFIYLSRTMFWASGCGCSCQNDKQCQSNTCSHVLGQCSIVVMFALTINQTLGTVSEWLVLILNGRIFSFFLSFSLKKREIKLKKSRILLF
jgi:hypothetical protein